MPQAPQESRAEISAAPPRERFDPSHSAHRFPFAKQSSQKKAILCDSIFENDALDPKPNAQKDEAKSAKYELRIRTTQQDQHGRSADTNGQITVSGLGSGPAGRRSGRRQTKHIHFLRLIIFVYPNLQKLR